MPGPGSIKDAGDAARALEATLLRQLLASSGAFKGSELAGEQLHAQMFVEALADAVSQSGGLGLSKLLENSLGDAKGSAEGKTSDAPAEEPHAHPTGSHPASPKTPGPVSSGFGMRMHPIDGVEKFHTGIDLRGKEGTPILAAQDGVVRSAGTRGGYGNAVEIDHGNGVTTLYGHAAELEVKPGDHVQKGEEIGQVGMTGRATGPHLHFEVRVEGKPVDPKGALKAYGIRADNSIGGSTKTGF
jgi:murein DD-endopeptidase MepM/ murein hydrolase activator NlpD